MEVFKWTTARLLPIAIVVGTLAFGSARPAGATNPYTRTDHRCPVGAVCLYKDKNFSGGKGVVVFPQGLYKVSWSNYKNAPKFPDGSSLNDKVSSIINNSAFTFRFWLDKDHSNPREPEPVLGLSSRIGALSIPPGRYGYVADLKSVKYAVCGTRRCNSSGGCYCSYSYYKTFNDRISSHN